MAQEVRISEKLKAELRDADSKRYIEGYASVAEVPTVIWYFEEVVAKGAFTRVLEELSRGEQDVRSLFNHDANYVLGRTAKDGFPATLELSEDNKGLWTRTEAPPLGENPLADTVISNIKRGAVTGMSFAFTVRKQEWEFFDDPDRMDRRTITEVGVLYDIGPVTYPAYAQTSVGVRMKTSAKKEHDEARSRWQERRNSRIVVPKEYEHSLFEMRMNDEENWQEQPENLEQPVNQEANDEKTKEETPISNTEASESSGQEEGQENSTASAEESAGQGDQPAAEGAADNEVVADEASCESEARNRQIEIKRKIAAVSSSTRAVLKKY